MSDQPKLTAEDVRMLIDHIGERMKRENISFNDVMVRSVIERTELLLAENKQLMDDKFLDWSARQQMSQRIAELEAGPQLLAARQQRAVALCLLHINGEACCPSMDLAGEILTILEGREP